MAALISPMEINVAGERERESERSSGCLECNQDDTDGRESAGHKHVWPWSNTVRHQNNFGFYSALLERSLRIIWVSYPIVSTTLLDNCIYESSKFLTAWSAICSGGCSHWATHTHTHTYEDKMSRMTWFCRCVSSESFLLLQKIQKYSAPLLVR